MPRDIVYYGMYALLLGHILSSKDSQQVRGPMLSPMLHVHGLHGTRHQTAHVHSGRMAFVTHTPLLNCLTVNPA